MFFDRLVLFVEYALLIKGARRVGKSTIAEEFAKKEFKSYILIDFANTSSAIIDLFDDMYDLDFFFLQLQQFTGIRLYEKESVIIFDEVKISMYPMDFEEFLWAIEDEVSAETIKFLMKNNKPAGNVMHRNLMRVFRLYMLIGGMPQAIETYKEKVGEYGFELVEKGITNAAEIPQAVDLLVSEVDCISNMTDNTVVENLPILLEKATAKNIPVFGSEEEQVGNGCIASAGIDYIELGKKAGIMAARVLKGEDIKNIPYETLTESKITINTDAAEKIGVTIPQSITDRAEVKNAPSES